MQASEGSESQQAMAAPSHTAEPYTMYNVSMASDLVEILLKSRPRMSPSSRSTLECILHTLCPALAGVDSAYAVDAIVADLTSWKVTSEEKQKLLMGLWLLSTGFGTALVCFSSSMTPFAKRTAEEREALLLRLGTSRFPHQRMMFNGFKRVFLSIAGSATMKGKNGAAATNPLWQLADYPGMAPVHALPPASPLPVHPSEAMPSVEDSSDRADVGNDCIECDVLIIGSGAGDSNPPALLPCLTRRPLDPSPKPKPDPARVTRTP